MLVLNIALVSMVDVSVTEGTLIQFQLAVAVLILNIALVSMVDVRVTEGTLLQFQLEMGYVSPKHCFSK